MNRLLATTQGDFRLQFRNGFYYASAFVAVILVIILKQFPEFDFRPWWPAIIMMNLTINTFYFMSGLVLLEKSEGTLEAQIVTPLRPREYLFSKMISLGALSVFETLLIVVLVQGWRFNWVWLLTGIFALVFMYALYGFFVVARYDSINEFLLPSVLWTMLYSLPLLYYFGLIENWLFYLHPMLAPLLLLKAAFQPVETWQLLYGMGYSIIWVAVAYWAARRSFYRFIVRKEGT